MLCLDEIPVGCAECSKRCSARAAGHRNRSPHDRGLIYFVQPVSGGPVKIGTAVKPVRRLRHLQQGNPERLVILALLDGGPLTETRLHWRFGRHRLRPGCEWFHPVPELLDFIAAEARAAA